MKLEELVVGSVYKLEYNDEEFPDANYEGNGTLLKIIDENYNHGYDPGTLVFKLPIDPPEDVGYFGIDNVKSFVNGPKFKVGYEGCCSSFGDFKILDILKSDTRFCYLIFANDQEFYVNEDELDN